MLRTSLLIALMIALAGCNNQLHAFAECLAEKNVKMYGAYWCPHCANQKELFGNSWEHINYVECSLPDKAGQTEICRQAGIKAYPTWEFADGTRTEGVLSLAALAEKSGCALEAEP